MDAAEIVPLQIDPVRISCQHAGTARHRGPADGRIVVKDRADADHAVRPVENLASAGGADLAPVDTGGLGMSLWKEALRCGHVNDGQPSASASSIACFSAPAARSLL